MWQLSQRSRLFGYYKILVFLYLLRSFSVPFTANFGPKNKIKPKLCKPLLPKNKMPTNTKIAVFSTENEKKTQFGRPLTHTLPSNWNRNADESNITFLRPNNIRPSLICPALLTRRGVCISAQRRTGTTRVTSERPPPTGTPPITTLRARPWSQTLTQHHQRRGEQGGGRREIFHRPFVIGKNT